jgi:hypothetical protein
MKSEVQRASDGSSVASGNVENQLAASKGGGSPLPEMYAVSWSRALGQILATSKCIPTRMRCR